MSSPPSPPPPVAAVGDQPPSMECSIYQNYSASEVFVQGLAGFVDQQDVEAVIRAQKKMLQRFEKTNEMLSNCNTLSATRFERATRDFKAHTAKLAEMKKDLDVVLKRIAALKQRIAAQNPEAFHAAGGNAEPTGEEDDEYDEAIKQRRRTTSTEEAKEAKPES